MSEYHIPVLLKESIGALNIKSNGIYLDLTFGGGGHSKEVLKCLGENGVLIAFDQDGDAIKNVPDDKRLKFVNHNFKYFRNFLRYYGYEGADGILADLGVSSHEFDEAGRGFSFRYDAELDMRMNQKNDLTAVKILAEYSKEELATIFRNYGEVKNARHLADVIILGREDKPIITSEDLYKIIYSCIPKAKEKKYLAQVYQALRIEVNKELDVLAEMLEQALEALNKGGRLVVITYHSLEDRIVKNFFKSGRADGVIIKDEIYGGVVLGFKQINRKVIIPSDEEIERNPRARSAKLRILEKL